MFSVAGFSRRESTVLVMSGFEGSMALFAAVVLLSRVGNPSEMIEASRLVAAKLPIEDPQIVV